MSNPPVDGDTARRLAEQELARPEYRQGGGSWLQRALNAVERFLADLFGGAGQGTTLVLTVVVVLLLAVVVFAAVRAGKLPGRTRRTRAARDPLAPEDGVDHAARAAAHAAAGRHAEAVREYLRATVAALERAGVLTPRPGRTGASAAREAGARLPVAAPALAAGALAFDETWFGARPAGPADVTAARGAHEAVLAAARAVPVAAALTGRPAGR